MRECVADRHRRLRLKRIHEGRQINTEPTAKANNNRREYNASESRRSLPCIDEMPELNIITTIRRIS
jgi:hypothetical protein